MKQIEVAFPRTDIATELKIAKVLIMPGETVTLNQPLVIVESGDIGFELPSTHVGRVDLVKVKAGDRVVEGDLLFVISSENAAHVNEVAASRPERELISTVNPSANGAVTTSQPAFKPAYGEQQVPTKVAPVGAPASPSVRRLSAELNVSLADVTGTGPNGRVTREDIHKHQSMVENKRPVGGVAPSPVQRQAKGSPLEVLPWPSIDFEKFGAVELRALSRLKKISGKNLHRNWVAIPHVTHFDEADVTSAEDLRRNCNLNPSRSGAKLTLLAFVMKACVTALKKFPLFNSSLDETNENLILKRYYHIGFAVDTPDGLLVPVIKDVNQKGIIQIAQEMSELSTQARTGKVKVGDLQGASFTISSLGSIGGTFFTPIINAPEVAILGLTKTTIKPFWDSDGFVPRLMLPLSLSYDHRVIDGALAARFTAYMAEILGDMRKMLM